MWCYHFTVRIGLQYLSCLQRVRQRSGGSWLFAENMINDQINYLPHWEKLPHSKTLRKYTICLQPAFPVLLISILFRVAYITIRRGSQRHFPSSVDALHRHILVHRVSAPRCSLCTVPLSPASSPSPCNWAQPYTRHQKPIPHPLHRFPQDSGIGIRGFISALRIPSCFCDCFSIISTIFFLEMWVSGK